MAIYVGRLEESKGVIKLLEVWNELDEKYKLTIIGSGNIEEELKEKYKGQISHLKEYAQESIVIYFKI